MPLYEFKCECGNSEEKVLTIANRNKKVSCKICDEVMSRIVSCKIERVEPTYLDEMKFMLPPKERAKVVDRTSFKQALDRSGLVCI